MDYINLNKSTFLIRSLLVLFLALIYVSENVSWAEPYIAIREGYKCSQCHVNMTGGGKRNDFGNIYTQTILPMSSLGSNGFSWGREKDKNEEIPFFTGKVSEFISFGGHLRTQAVVNKIPNQIDTAVMKIDKGLMFTEINIVPQYITLYYDHSVAPGSSENREAFALIKGLPLNGYLKTGKFYHPYGFRLQDDNAFIRQVTGFNYNARDTGVEVGIEPGDFSFFAAVTNGTQGAGETDKNKQVTLYGAAIYEKWRVGGSYSYNDQDRSIRAVRGLFAGANIGKFTLLGEFDLLTDKEDGLKETNALVTHAELDYLIMKGFNMKFAYEFYDPNSDIDEDERERWVLGAEMFNSRFFQTRLFLRVNNGIPQNDLQNASELLAEMNMFF